MKLARRVGGAVAPAIAFLAAVGAVRAQALPADSCATISAIEVRGAVKMSADAVRFDLGIKPGARWDPSALHREYMRFWKRGYFSDLRFLRRCDPAGAVLIVELKERPTIISVNYDKSKEVTQTQIEDYFKQRNFSLAVGSPLDRKKIWRAETLIEEVLGQKGYMDADVRAEIRESGANTRSVQFRIRAGGKTKIRELNFTGNENFSDSKLRGQLQLIRPYRWWWPWSSKYLYHPLKYQQDLNNILQFYRDNGYLDADAQPAIVDIRPVDPEKAEKKAIEQAEKDAKKREKERRKAAEKGEAPPPSAAENEPSPPDVKTRKWVYITVPMEEGKVYRLGEVKFEGASVFDAKTLRPYVPLRDGAVLADSALEAGLRLIRELYGVRGYVYAAATRRFERREGGEPIADVVIQVEEDQAYSLRRIEFRGNSVTNDEVLRREMNVQEGELLNKAQLDRSMQKLQMLGFWMPAETPTLQPAADLPEVDVRIQGEEQNRNEVQIGGGYSELEGAFFLGSFQTLNFLGRGESLGLYLAAGSRANRASISFTEPWFLGRPYTFGFQLFRRSNDYGTTTSGSFQARLSQTATGGAVTIGRRLGDFTRVQVTYDYQSVDYSTLDLSSQFATSSTRIGALTPIFSYRRTNFSLRPTNGFEFTFSPRVVAESLGADANYFEPTINTTLYRPLFWRFFGAAHLRAAWLKPFGDVLREPGYIDGVPRFERFFLGGDILGPRVFETRSISPIRVLVSVDQNGDPLLDAFGNPIVVPAYVGGDKQVLFQFELGVPIAKTATFAAFFDAGGVYDTGNSVDIDQMRMSAGVEFRVFLPVFQAPIRLIYGWPVQELPGDNTNRFQFSIGLPF